MSEEREVVLGNETDERYISVWLMPQEEEAQILQGVVDTLAGEFGTHPFEPHLTVVSGFYGEPADIQQSLTPIAGMRNEPFVFEVDDVVVGDRMTKTFYVSFKPNPAFEEYCQPFTVVPATQGKPSVPAPHMSLMYKAGGPAGFDEEQRARLKQVRQEIKVKLLVDIPAISFDRVSLVTSNRTLSADTDVLDYRTVQNYPL